MVNLKVEYSTYETALPPQPITIKVPGWAGGPEKMEEGTLSQPWHCLPFVEGATYGLELVYPHETECHIVNENWVMRMEFDYRKEPGGILTGGEFGFFAPQQAPRQYFFMPRIDIQPPPGYVVRTEPHPRYFTDTTGTVPTAMIAHLQNEWFPKLLLVVFRVPWPGQRHIFRKGEAFAQLLLVPHHLHYEMTPMSPAKAAERRELEKAIQFSRRTLATNPRQGVDGNELDNHYKILAGAFAAGGLEAVKDSVQAACARREQALTAGKTIPECLALGAQLVNERKMREAKDVYLRVLGKEPNNAEALSQIGICLVMLGHIDRGVEAMSQATALQPHVPRFHGNLGEMMRLLNRFSEAEAEFRWSLQFNPHDAGIVSLLGMTLAQQGRLAEGEQVCRNALQMNAKAPALYFRLGWVHHQQGRYREARACYEAALGLDPAHAASRQALQALPANA